MNQKTAEQAIEDDDQELYLKRWREKHPDPLDDVLAAFQQMLRRLLVLCAGGFMATSCVQIFGK